MLRSFEFAKTYYRLFQAYLRRQAQTGEYWQPRCYTGDPRWHSNAQFELPTIPSRGRRIPALGQSRALSGLSSQSRPTVGGVEPRSHAFAGLRWAP